MPETRSILVAFVTVSTALSSGFGATIRVPDDRGLIQEALGAAKDGDTILVAPGEYPITESLRLGPPLTPRDLVLKSTEGPGLTVIRMLPPEDGGGGSVLLLEGGEASTTTIQGFTFAGGTGTPFEGSPWNSGGGGIFCLGEGSSSVLRECEFLNNSAEIGGGVAVFGASSPQLIMCTITRNTTAVAGGGMYCGLDSSAEIKSCRIESNFALCDGGGVFCSLDATLFDDCLVLGNSAEVGGGVKALCRTGCFPRRGGRTG